MILALVWVVGCSDLTQTDGDNSVTVEEVGYLSIANMSLSVNQETENLDSDMQKSAATKASSEFDDYVIKITSEKYDTMSYSLTYAELKEQEVYSLYPGIYTVEISSEAECPGVEWEHPYYQATQSIVIVSGETTDVGDVVCTLSNIKVSVTLNASMQDLFLSDSESEVPLTVTIGVGDSSQIFSRTEERSAYFAAEDGDNEMTINISGMYNMASEDEEPDYILIDNWQETITGVRAGEWRKILLKINGAYDGNVEFELTVDNLYYDEPLGVDVMHSSYAFYAFGEETIVDPDATTSHANSPVLSYASGESVDDTFVIGDDSFNFDAGSVLKPLVVNVTPTEGSTVETLSIAVSSTNLSLVEAISAMGLDADNISLLPSSELDDVVTLRTDASTGVVTLTLKNAAMFSLFEYGGVHTIDVTAVDSEGRRSYTTLTVEVEAITIEWLGGYDFDTRYTIPDEDLTVVIVINSSSGLEGLTVEIVSDVLNEDELSSINLSTYMDMVNPATDLMQSNLERMGFKTGDDVVGATYMEIDITEFMSALASLGTDFNTDFILTATDASGVVAKTIMLYAE